MTVALACFVKLRVALSSRAIIRSVATYLQATAVRRRTVHTICAVDLYAFMRARA